MSSEVFYLILENSVGYFLGPESNRLETVSGARRSLNEGLFPKGASTPLYDRIIR